MQINSNVKIKGEITAKIYDQSSLSIEDQDHNKKIVALCDRMVEGYKFTKWDEYINRMKRLFGKKVRKTKYQFMLATRQWLLSNYRFGSLKMTDKHINVICNSGFNAITRLLTGDTTYTGEINKAILGTGSTGSASASDTTLETEAYRNDIASATASSNIAFLTAFFTEVECNGTYTEFGNCIDGEAGADTGQLWSHLKGLNWVKDSTTALVVSCKYTFASV